MSHGSSSTSWSVVRVSRLLGHLAKAGCYISCRGTLSCQEGWSSCSGIIQSGLFHSTSLVSFRLSSHHHKNQNNLETRDQTNVPKCLLSLAASFSGKKKKRRKRETEKQSLPNKHHLLWNFREREGSWAISTPPRTHVALCLHSTISISVKSQGTWI